MSDLGKRGNLGSVDGIIKTAHADGEGGLIIHSETDMTAFVDHTKRQFNNRSEKTGWGDKPLDPRNKIAELPPLVIEDLNKMGIMRGYHIIDPKGMAKWLNNPDNRVFRTRGGNV
jgi:hypothetical protein